MSTETTATPVTETPASTEAQDPGKLSFSEYETFRRTGEMPKAEVVEESKSASAESTPAAQKEAEESETPATEEKEETKDESEAEGDEPKAEDESASGEKPKKKGGFQRRIDKLNAQKSAAQQEVEYWKQLALKGAGATSSDTPAPKAATPATQATEGKPSPDQHEDHASYVEALTDWKVEQKLKDQASKAEQAKFQTEQQTLVQSYAEKARAFAEKTDDYFDVLEAAEGLAPWSPAVQRLVLKSGPELAYEIAKNQEEFKRINRLSPIDAAEAVGEIKARLISSKAPEAKTEQKKTTQAPKPLAPLGGGNASAKKTPESMSFQEYEAYRREQMKRRRA